MAIPDSMAAAVLHGPGDLRIESVGVPRPAKGEVLVKVGACGICGSDVPRVMTKGTYSFPLIPGHEFAGTIAALGEGVGGWREGDRVAVFPLIPCRECDMCEEETYELCQSYDYLGSRSNGAFAEYVVAPAWNLIGVPEGVSMEVAAMTEPAAVACHGVSRGNVSDGDTAAVFGAGPIGIIITQWCAALGAGPLWIVDIQPDKLAVADELTEATCLNGMDADAAEVILDATGGKGVDAAIEAAGVPATALQCIAAAARNGTVVLLGNPSTDLTIPMADVSQILRKQLEILGTWNSSFGHDENDDWTATLRAMASGKLNLEPLITHRYRIDQANEAFRMMTSGGEFYNKVMFVFE
ncbi:MAG TPA: galactitol-1-phosphate 5-dehydrogenase [Armatimonadota bacterium]|nr:galactitol-1-phosphate 5-dehydrogenase [Armatimonadota bacterium]